MVIIPNIICLNFVPHKNNNAEKSANCCTNCVIIYNYIIFYDTIIYLCLCNTLNSLFYKYWFTISAIMSIKSVFKHCNFKSIYSWLSLNVEYTILKKDKIEIVNVFNITKIRTLWNNETIDQLALINTSLCKIST